MSDSALSSDLAPPPYADARALVRRSLEGFRPPPRITTAEYAFSKRWLTNPGGGFTGRWNPDEAPYLTGPMKALDSRRYTTIALVGPGQCGKTTVAENWLLKSAAIDPATMLWFMQTDRAMRDYVKEQIDRLIETHAVLSERLGRRPSDNTQEYKRFPGMGVHFLVAAPNNLISRRAPRIIVDEIDAYDPNIGDVMGQVDIRRQTFGSESMVLVISHPDLARGLSDSGWKSGVMQVYGRSDRGIWWWPCPHCNGWSSPNPTASRVMTLDYPEDAPLDEIADAARLLCPLCGVLIEDKHRRAMNIEAARNPGDGWVYRGQTIDENGRITGDPVTNDTGGFWITGAMSTFTMGGLGGLARAMVEARRRYADDRGGETERDLRQVFTKRWGIPYTASRQVGSLDANTLAERVEHDLVLGQVPDGVRFLTAWADTQAADFRILVRGWGVNGESWVIALVRRPADTTGSPEDWDALIEWALTAEFPLADGSGRVMRIRGFGYDAFGLPGVTQQAYDAFVRMARKRRIRMLGMTNGRAVWNVLPTKGMPGINAQRLAVIRPDTQRSDRLVKISGGTLQLMQFSANAFKDDLAGHLGRMPPGAWAVHLPAGLLSPAPPHRWFEELVAEQRQPNGAWKKARDSDRNEAMDQMVGTHALAHLHGLRQIDWTRPPAWAGPWDTNPMVGPATLPRAAPTATDRVVTKTEAPAQAPIATTTATVTVMPRARLFAGLAARMKH